MMRNCRNSGSVEMNMFFNKTALAEIDYPIVNINDVKTV
jgi:hypothetical protein